MVQRQREDEVGVAESRGASGQLEPVSGSPFWTATEPKYPTTAAGLTAVAAAGEEEIGATASTIGAEMTCMSSLVGSDSCLSPPVMSLCSPSPHFS